MQSIPPFRRHTPPSRPANDVDAAMARVVMPIGDEEARVWDAIVESRLPKAA